MIERAIERAYAVMEERNWDTVYWAIDLHGTVLKSNYENGGYEFISESVRDALRYIAALPESIIILWSSLHADEWNGVVEFFHKNGIRIDFHNCNPQVTNTETGNFDQKFYFSVLVDDKAGFHPDEWTTVADTVRRRRERLQ